MIISGVNSNSELTVISDADMLKLIKKRFEGKASARLLCIFVICYSLPDKEFKKLVESLKSDQDTVNRIRNLSGNSNKSLKRVAPVMND